MFNNHTFKNAQRIAPGMEVITADGKRAGYVETVVGAEMVTRSPKRHIPLDCIRRVDEDVYIGLRAQQLLWD
jgi:hypothetical protein